MGNKANSDRWTMDTARSTAWAMVRRAEQTQFGRGGLGIDYGLAMIADWEFRGTRTTRHQPAAPNKPNWTRRGDKQTQFPGFWPENEDQAEKQSQSNRGIGGRDPDQRCAPWSGVRSKANFGSEISPLRPSASGRNDAKPGRERGGRSGAPNKANPRLRGGKLASAGRRRRVCENILAITNYAAGRRPCHPCAEPALSAAERAGVQETTEASWIPACAGMTGPVGSRGCSWTGISMP